MSIEFHDSDTEALVRQLAARLEVSPEEAIEIAVREAIQRFDAAPQRPAPPPRDAKPGGGDKNAFTELNEDG